MKMRLQRLPKPKPPRRANDMAEQVSGKQAVGAWLKSRGTAIGVTVGVILTATGDYLLGDTGLIPYAIGLIKQAIAFF